MGLRECMSRVRRVNQSMGQLTILITLFIKLLIDYELPFLESEDNKVLYGTIINYMDIIYLRNKETQQTKI